MTTLVQDLRYAARTLRKSPGFTAVAVLTLALCIGANLAIFAVVDAILVRSLPLPDADRLVVVHNAYPGAGIKRGNASIANYFERREAIEAFESVIDEALARQYWPEGNAVGRRFSTDPYSNFDKKLFGDVGSQFVEPSAYTVVGIVGNVKQDDLAETEKRGAVYLPYTDSLKFQMVIRTSVPASVTAPTVEKLVRQLDPELPINDFKTMQARIDDSLVTRRSPAILTVMFAGVALLLAAIGTYGVLAYAVSQRRREVGVRMALGATPDQIGRQFMSLGLRLLAVGALLGCIGAWAAGRAMQSILFEVPSLHIPTVAGTAVAMSLATLLASLLPAIRAARIAPAEAMRNE
jgi:hypothetical protein